MAFADGNLTTALARLESRWGSAAVRLASDGSRAAAPKAAAEERIPTDVPAVHGALALVSRPIPEQEPDVTRPASLPDEIIPTGFARLDQLLGTGGLPRGVSAAFRGSPSSGKTALALHCLAQAQARGGIVAFLDLCRVFDPLEAVARGVDLRWLLVVRPPHLNEGWAISAALVAGRQVDLLIVDLPSRMRTSHETSLRRLAAHARRSSVRVIVLEPTGLAPPVHGAVAESVALRLELEQRAWLRAGRDVVGRRIAVNVAKNRFGPPGRETEIEIRYLADGEQQSAVDRFAMPDSALPQQVAFIHALPTA
jgi:RecA/RadA recombinase